MFVIGTLLVGGTELHLVRVAQMLVTRGWRVSVFSLAGDGPLRAEFERGGVEVLLPPVSRTGKRVALPVRAMKFMVVAWALFVVMLRRRPPVVHFFLPAAYLTGAPLALIARVPILVMSRRSLNQYQAKSRFLARLESVLHAHMDVVLGNSRAIVHQLTQEGAAPSRLALIYNGVDVALYRQSSRRGAVRSQLGVSGDAIVFIIVANLIGYKGHQDLLTAFAAARPRLGLDWRLLVVGRDDGLGSALRKQTTSLGLSENVLFLGSRNDVPDLLCSADIGLLASHEEGFSNAILEKMAAGLPVIATNVGGNAEAVIDGKTGLIVPARDSDRMRIAIERLAGDASLRQQMGREGAARIEAHFRLEACLSCYESLYTGILAGRSPADIDCVRSVD